MPAGTRLRDFDVVDKNARTITVAWSKYDPLLPENVPCYLVAMYK